MKKVSEIARNLVPKFEGCAMCADNPGWIIEHLPDTVTADSRTMNLNARRCLCWEIHQQKVTEALKKAQP